MLSRVRSLSPLTDAGVVLAILGVFTWVIWRGASQRAFTPAQSQIANNAPPLTTDSSRDLFPLHRQGQDYVVSGSDFRTLGRQLVGKSIIVSGFVQFHSPMYARNGVTTVITEDRCSQVVLLWQACPDKLGIEIIQRRLPVGTHLRLQGVLDSVDPDGTCYLRPTAWSN